MKEIVDETLTTYFTTFAPDGVLKPEEEFFKLSRKAAIHELQKDLKEQERVGAGACRRYNRNNRLSAVY